jgi:hypothetical protein
MSSSAASPRVSVLIVQAVAALLVTVPASAQAPARAAATLLDAIHLVAADLGAETASGSSIVPPRSGATAVRDSRQVAVEDGPARPGALLPLYGSFAALQAMDAHSTVRAVRGGAVERNPLLAPVGHNAGAMFAIKAATTVGTIVLVEKLRRRHPMGAVVLMVAVNAAYGAIVVANYRK